MKPRIGQVVTAAVEVENIEYTVTLIWMKHITDGHECWFVKRSEPVPPPDLEEVVMSACLDRLAECGVSGSV